MALVSRSKYFTEKELACHCGCGQVNMDSDFMEMLDNLRWRYNHPLILSSAYRCPDYNAEVSSTGIHGPHTTGKAVDIKIYGEPAHRLLLLAATMPFTGFGFSQKGKHAARFIHLDTVQGANRPGIWSY